VGVLGLPLGGSGMLEQHFQMMILLQLACPLAFCANLLQAKDTPFSCRWGEDANCAPDSPQAESALHAAACCSTRTAPGPHPPTPTLIHSHNSVCQRAAPVYRPHAPTHAFTRAYLGRCCRGRQGGNDAHCSPLPAQHASLQAAAPPACGWKPSPAAAAAVSGSCPATASSYQLRVRAPPWLPAQTRPGQVAVQPLPTRSVRPRQRLTAAPPVPAPVQELAGQRWVSPRRELKQALEGRGAAQLQQAPSSTPARLVVTPCCSTAQHSSS